MKLLEVRDLTKNFGALRAVDHVSFALDPGEVRALIGPNGAGKTTCFNMLFGLLSPDEGSIRYRGEDITREPPQRIWRRGVGRTFQIAATFVSMTVRENVQMALLSHHRRAFSLLRPARRLFREEADALLAAVGLLDQAARPAAVLAYGDLRRLEIAIALVHRPDLLLMDEPTAGMAARERFELMELVAGLVAERGIGVLFTEHDMDVVFGFAERIMVMDHGRLLTVGTPEEVRADPRVREVYLGRAVGRPAAVEMLDARGR